MPGGSSLAIATCTAVLKDLLDNRLVQRDIASIIGDVVVSALPPDRIQTGSEERPQLNLFLYRVTPNTRWRGDASSRGESAIALDLHYLLSAYGGQDLQQEVLLGYAVQVFREVPRLDQEHIRSALTAMSKNGATGSRIARAVAGAGDAPAWAGNIDITADFQSLEDVSKLWSALQSRYRPSVTYKVSMVLIDER
jgi:hypothetical protein